MGLYDLLNPQAAAGIRPGPQFNPDTGTYDYSGVYDPTDPNAPPPGRAGHYLALIQQQQQARDIAASNPEAQAQKAIAGQASQGHKGIFGRLFNIPKEAGSFGLGVLGALGQANLEGGKEAREGLHGQEIVNRDQYGNTQDTGQHTRGGLWQALTGAAKGYVGGLTGHAKTNVTEALGGKIAGAALPKAGAGRIATDLVGGVVTDPLSWLAGGGAAARGFKTAGQAAEAVGGKALAERLGAEGLGALEGTTEHADILKQIEQQAAAHPSRFARGTAAERAAKTVAQATKYGKEGLHLNVPLVPGAHLNLAGGALEGTAANIDKALGVSGKLGALGQTERATKLKGLLNPRAGYEAVAGPEAAATVRDAERRAAELRIDLTGDAQKVAANIYKAGNNGVPFSDSDITYARRALDQGTDTNQMIQQARAAGKEGTADLIEHLRDTTRRGDVALKAMGVPAEHLLEAGNFVPRTPTPEGAKAFAALDNPQLQRLFGLKSDAEVQSLRQEIERGSTIRQRVFHGPLEQAERQAKAITGQNIQHFESDPTKAILGHYQNVVGAYSHRSMLNELEGKGLIKAQKAGNIEAGTLGGNYQGPKELADYFNRRATPRYRDPSLAAFEGLRGKASQAWKATALNWPGTAFKHSSGVGIRAALEGVGSSAYRAARQSQKGLQWAIENPAEIAAEGQDLTRLALPAGPKAFGELARPHVPADTTGDALNEMGLARLHNPAQPGISPAEQLPDGSQMIVKRDAQGNALGWVKVDPQGHPDFYVSQAARQQGHATDLRQAADTAGLQATAGLTGSELTNQGAAAFGRHIHPIEAPGPHGGVPAPLAAGLDVLKGHGAPAAIQGAQGAVTPGALDALKGIAGGGPLIESRVGQKIRQVAEGAVPSPVMRPEEAGFLNQARQQGATLPGFSRAMAGANEIGTTKLQRGISTLKKGSFLRGGSRFGVENFEQKARLGLFHKLTAEGVDANQAAREVERAFFNYSDTSPAMQKLRGISPFISFKAKNLQRTLGDIAHNAPLATYPTRAEGALMEEKQRSGPSLVSKMAEGQIPIPGTNAYAKLNIPGDTALADINLAPRLLAALPGNAADKNLTGDLLSELGGPEVGVGKALVEQRTGQNLFTGGKIKPGLANNPFIQELLPPAGRVGALAGPKPAGAKLASLFAGMPASLGGDQNQQISEVFRAADVSPANAAADAIQTQIHKAEAAGDTLTVQKLRAVQAWIKANPAYIQKYAQSAGKNPANQTPAQRLRAEKPPTSLLARLRASYSPPAA